MMSLIFKICMGKTPTQLWWRSVVLRDGILVAKVVSVWATKVVT